MDLPGDLHNAKCQGESNDQLNHCLQHLRPEIIENICKLVAGKPDIWYATNWEIARYAQACEAAEKASKFPEIVNPTAETLYLLVDGKQITLAPKSKINLK